jgi:hypothetical protein
MAAGRRGGRRRRFRRVGVRRGLGRRHRRHDRRFGDAHGLGEQLGGLVVTVLRPQHVSGRDDGDGDDDHRGGGNRALLPQNRFAGARKGLGDFIGLQVSAFCSLHA